MPLTNQDKEWLAFYENAPGEVMTVIDKAYEAAVNEMIDAGYKITNDDRSESLVAALTRYVVESGNTNLGWLK